MNMLILNLKKLSFAFNGYVPGLLADMWDKSKDGKW